jgi:hypothetical protein
MSIFLRSFAFSSRRPISSLSRFGLRQFATETQTATPPPPPGAGATAEPAPETPETMIVNLNTKVAELKDLLLRQMAGQSGWSILSCFS